MLSDDSDSDDGDDIMKPRRRCIAHYLPPELIDMVIDFLHNDRPSLLACSLVCRSWLPESRVHLFHTVHVQTVRSALPSENVSFLIRKLAWGPRKEPFLDSARWCTGLDILAPRLTCLRSLALTKLIVTPIRRTKQRFAILGAEMPTVERLRIADCDFGSLPSFVAFLQAFPGLAHLELKEVENWSSEADPAYSSPSAKWDGPRLESLSCALLNSWPFIDWLLTTNTPRILQKLVYSILEPSIIRNTGALADLLRSCGDNLRELTIDSGLQVDISVTHTPIDLTLAHNVSLTHLTLQTFSPSLLFYLLQSIRSPQIRQLNLELWMAFDILGGEAGDDESWKNSEDVLSSAFFRHLERVTLVPVSYLLGQTEADVKTLTAIRARLASAERQGILFCSQPSSLRGLVS